MKKLLAAVTSMALFASLFCAAAPAEEALSAEPTVETTIIEETRE